MNFIEPPGKPGILLSMPTLKGAVAYLWVDPNLLGLGIWIFSCLQPGNTIKKCLIWRFFYLSDCLYMSVCCTCLTYLPACLSLCLTVYLTACPVCMRVFLSKCLPTACTANEGPVRIQYKCLVPIYISQKWNCVHPPYFQNRIIMICLPIPTLTYLWEIYIFQDQSVYFAEAKYVDWSWEYIHQSQTHECGVWDWGRAIPRREIHKWDFRCSMASRFSHCVTAFTSMVTYCRALSVLV